MKISCYNWEFDFIIEQLKIYNMCELFFKNKELELSVNAHSALIERILMSFPIPPCSFYIDKYGERHLLDGFEQTKVLIDFIDNKFELSSLEKLKQYNGCKFDDLPTNMQFIINLCIVTVYEYSDTDNIEEVKEALKKFKEFSTWN